MNFIKRIPKFIGEVRVELSKVSWSTPQELKGATIVVISITAILALYIGTVDLVLSRALAWILK